jgi:hypothetical protein
VVTIGGALLLGSTFLAAPLGAQTVSELKEELAALEVKVAALEASVPPRIVQPSRTRERVVGWGTFPGSYKLPGTNTTFRIGGYVKFDAHYTTVQGLGDSFFAGCVPLDGILSACFGGGHGFSDGHTRLFARQSRLNVQTRTPSKLGLVRTYIEGDFFDPARAGSEIVSNGSAFRLRHAYGAIGNLLVGQTWSNFMHLAALPDTLDFAGSAGVWFARQAQIRYSVSFGESWRADVSVENPDTHVFVFGPPGGGSFGTVGRNEDRIPDVTAKVTFGGAWGFVSVAGLFGVADINTLAFHPFGAAVAGGGRATAILDDTQPFWAVHAGTRIFTFGRDSVAGTLSYSDGGGRTLYPFPGVSFPSFADVSVPNAPTIENVSAYAGNVSYERWWRENLFSTAAYGISHFEYPAAFGLLAGNFPETQQTVHVNLLWVPVPRVTLGIEWMLGVTDWFGPTLGQFFRFNPGGIDDDATDQRVQISARFSF